MKILTELKSRIKAPKGYCVVGSDISGQELQLASILADHEAGGFLGASPMTHQIIAGNKENFSDAHSVIAYELFLRGKGYRIIDGEWYMEE